MWNRLTLRSKITIITAIALSAVAIAITWLSIYNAGQIFITPYDLLESGAEPVEGHPDLFFVPELRADEVFADIQRTIEESQIRFRIISIVIVTTFVFIGVGGAYIISGQVLKPIKSLANNIEDIDTNNLGTLIEPTKSNDEVSRLTNSFNNMLGKIDRSFSTQRLFAQNAAHELKTPLAFVRASLDVLRLEEKPTEDDFMETFDIIRNSTDRLIELVEGLLSLNITFDEQKWQTFSGKDVLESIVCEMKEEITQRGVVVSILGDCRIKGDKTLLQRALFNLVHNAVRYNVDNGTVNITLEDESITIEDNGVGIPAEQLSYIFEPFYCVDKSRSKKLGGHGLGLAIAKNILDSHNIKIKITSDHEKGTTIILSK